MQFKKEDVRHFTAQDDDEMGETYVAICGAVRPNRKNRPEPRDVEPFCMACIKKTSDVLETLATRMNEIKKLSTPPKELQR